MSSPVLNPSSTWVAVGNGPSAITRRLGAVIDAHDCVVRFNRYETAGFEDLVGSRCTHWATHGLSGGKDKPPMVPGRNAAPPRWAMVVHENVRPEVELEGVVHPPRGLMTALKKKLGGNFPSTGLITVYWLLSHVGVRRLHLVGFDGFSKAKSSAHHYWDKRAFLRPKEHDGDAEMKLLKHWAQSGRVAFLS